MLTLREKQSIFAILVGKLIEEATARGYQITLGEVYRSPYEAERLAGLGKGIKNSLHTRRLAIDINLFKNGALLDKSEDYEPLGAWWEHRTTSDYECAWGGRFKRADGNHFSIAHNGIK